MSLYRAVLISVLLRPAQLFGRWENSIVQKLLRVHWSSRSEPHLVLIRVINQWPDLWKNPIRTRGLTYSKEHKMKFKGMKNEIQQYICPCHMLNQFFFAVKKNLTNGKKNWQIKRRLLPARNPFLLQKINFFTVKYFSLAKKWSRRWHRIKFK